MLEQIGLVISLIMLFIAVFCIFNARGIVKHRVETNNINKVVTIIKIIATIVAICCLLIIYYIK